MNPLNMGNAADRVRGDRGCGLSEISMAQASQPLPCSRYFEYREECWHIYYGDVHVGTIAIRSGMKIACFTNS
jgi:hypothetical protein